MTQQFRSSDENLAENDETFTVDDAFSAIGPGKFQYYLLTLCGSMMAADGMELMILAFLLPRLKRQWHLSPSTVGLVGAVVFMGMLVGAIGLSVIADNAGRRKVVIFSIVICAVGGFLSGLSPDVSFMLATRFFVGMGAGGSSVSFTLYTEFSQKESRGQNLMLILGFWSLGVLFSVALAAVTLPTLGWRWYLILASVPLWIISAFSLFVPESPRYLVRMGRTDEALEQLRRVAETNGCPERIPPGSLTECEDDEQSVSATFSDIFVPAYRYTSILLFITFFMCVYGYYGISLLSERFFLKMATGHKVNNEFVRMFISTCGEIPGIIFGYFLIDIWGRRLTLTVFFSLFSVCCFVLTAPFAETHPAFGVFFMFIARMCALLTISVSWVYFVEYYPTHIRATALGTASGLSRVAGIITTFTAESKSIRLGMIMYLVAGVISAGCAYMLPQDTTDAELTDVVDRSDGSDETSFKSEETPLLS